jgi:Lrp/AsnC family transcriptional regulator, regulator for asnA, asnC and gidA
MEIDKTDKKILNVLIKNSKQSLRAIAKKIGMSVVTVLKRVKVLEKEKIIKNYTIDPDYEQLGYDVSVIIKMRISKGKLFEIEKKIAIHPNVFAVYDVTGEFDSIILAKFKSRRSLDTFLKKIQTYEFVQRTETLLILNTIVEKKIMVE